MVGTQLKQTTIITTTTKKVNKSTAEAQSVEIAEVLARDMYMYVYIKMTRCNIGAFSAHYGIKQHTCEILNYLPGF